MRVQSVSTRVRTGREFGPIALLLLPIVLAYAIMDRFVLSVPLNDDYFSVVEFSLHFQALHTPAARLLYIATAQNLEYRFVFMHLLVAAELALLHRLEFAPLILMGNLFLLAILAILWKIFAAENPGLRRPLILFLPVPFLLMALDYADAVNFPSASLDYLPCIFFSLVAIGALTRPGALLAWRMLLIASAAAILAAFSAPNAVLLLPIGLVLVLPLRAYGKALLWCAAFAIGLSPYFFHYNQAPHDYARTILIMPLFFLSFLGAASSPHQLAIPLGLTILTLFLWACRSGFRHTHPGTFWCWAWLLGSGALVALGRSNFGLIMSLSSRYKMFSDMLLICCYQFAIAAASSSRITPARKRSLYQAALLFSILFCLRMDAFGWKSLRERRINVITGIQQFRQNPQSNSPMYFVDHDQEQRLSNAEANARLIIQQALATGLISLPDNPKPLW